MTIGFKPPIEHELGFALLGRNQANDVFTQTLRDPLFLDIGDESPLVLALSEVTDCINVCAHCALPGVRLRVGTKFPFAFLMAVICNGCTRSAKVSFSSAPRTTWLITCWLCLARQLCSKSQRPVISVLHSVSAIGPSRDAIRSATEISCVSRARL